MRRQWLIALLTVLCLLVPTIAHADTIDDFTLVGQGHTITYSLPNSAIVMNHPHAVWLNASAPATIDGVPGYNVSGEYYLPGFPNLPSIVLSVPSSINGDNLALFGPWVLQVSEVIPIDDPSIVHPNDLLVAFVTGTYDLITILGSAPFPSYTLTIATESASTPEPSTFALLGTGLLGAIAAVWRRVARH
jgi:PEP-CTERM motif-containing protein